jgi:hypothetical protein
MQALLIFLSMIEFGATPALVVAGLPWRDEAS